MRRFSLRVRTALRPIAAATLPLATSRLQTGGFDDDDDLLRDVQQQAATTVDVAGSRTPTPGQASLTQQFAADGSTPPTSPAAEAQR